ncbi:DUF1496 domain-containing protein [Vibrio sp. JPW-9-11-11]|nr:DUF1496 domain-containing protein [Vibrio sp. JPW-9-11-11]NVD06343.1 DUF1496 domain-containing protein [Vibrio sp. JPW-9-11-11]
MLCPALANTLTAAPKAVIGINANQATKRVCYYQDQAYSDGAIIQVGKHYMICSAANRFETHGALKWNPLDEQTTREAEDKTETKAVKRYSTN